MPSRLSTPRPSSQRRPGILALAAEAPCASSRPSCAGPATHAPRIAGAARNQDRYLMTLAPLTNTHNDRHRRPWLSAGRAACVSARIVRAMSVQKHFAAPQNVPLVRPDPNPDASVLERLKALPTLPVTHAPQPASK